MSAEIFYFSGTGNTLTVAKAIAARADAALVPIASLIGQDSIKVDADVVGIVFPVYYMEIPMIVEEFARKLEGITGKYIFAVCTYGGAAGASLRMLRRAIQSKGGVLSAGYGVPMPQNSFAKPGEDPKKKLEAWKDRVEFIVRKTEARARGMFYTNMWLELMLIPLHRFFIRPTCQRYFEKNSGLGPGLTYEEHKLSMDRNFSTSDKCSGCGTCARVCPVGNVEIRDKKPVWLHHCEHCLACYNWCPNKAIQGGITKNFYYRHPEVKVTEIMQQRQHTAS